MSDLPYATLVTEWQDAGFIGRVQVAMLTVALNVKMVFGIVNNESEQVIAEDRLARQIVNSPATWAPLFAFAVAIKLIGHTSLTDTTATTDGDVFSAVSAVFDSFLPPLQ